MKLSFLSVPSVVRIRLRHEDHFLEKKTNTET